MQARARQVNALPAAAEIAVHGMRAVDADGVAALMRDVYGNTYPKKYVYDPALLREKNTAGEITTVVATTPEGAVIGYAALSAYYGYPDIGLIGSLAVSPACRGRGLAGLLTRYLTGNRRGWRFHAITAGTFTAHPYSQRAMLREGFSPSAILLGSQPRELSFHKIAEELSQRESIAFYTRVQAPEEYGFQYLPGNYRRIIRDICKNLGIRIGADGTGKPGPSLTIAEHTLNPDTGAGMIWMRRIGPDHRPALAGAVRELRIRGARILRLHLDLSDPGATDAAAAAEEAGFVFAGILPGERGLVLLLQHLLDTEIDLRKINTADNPCGGRILAYIGTQIGHGSNGGRKTPQTHTAEG